MLEITTLICRVPTRMPKSTCGRSFSFALPAVHCRTGYVGRDGGAVLCCAVPHRVSPEERQEQTACYSTTQARPTHPGIGGWSSNGSTPPPPLLDLKAAVKW